MSLMHQRDGCDKVMTTSAWYRCSISLQFVRKRTPRSVNYVFQSGL